MNSKTKTTVIVLICIAIISIFAAFILMGNKTYKVSFNSNGGSYVTSQTVKKGQKATKPNDPTRDGYTFVEWQLDEKTYNFNSAVSSDITLDAVWSQDEVTTKYKITFNVDGQTKTVEVSDINQLDLQTLGFEEKKGYEINWYLNGKKYDFTKQLTGDVTLEGKYEKIVSYTVTFDSAGGNKVASQTVAIGGKAKEPTNVQRYGYILDGWYLNNKKYDFGAVVEANIKLVAKWKEDTSVKRYEVKFDSDGGTKVASQTVLENNTVKQPNAITKNGYAFEGWYLNDTKYNFNTKVTKNMTLVAKWRKVSSYTVTFNSNGGSSVSSQTIIDGEKATKPTDPTKNGYVFVEWQLNGKAYNFDSAVTGNITLTAVWKAKSKYTVIFNSNGGSSVTSQTITEGEKVTKPSNPTKSGYTFVEWQLNGKTYDFNSAVTGNITLTAVWKAKNKYTVTFNSNGGSSVTSQTITDGEKATKPSNPTKSGYTFVEWQLNGKAYDFNSAVTGNITLTAVWKAKNKYTVTFNSNGGSSVTSQTITDGEKATKPSNPTKSGYTFVEWQLNGKAYDFNSAVTGNITLTAVWKAKNKYTVKFNSNGGSSVTSQTITEGEKATKPSNPTKSGYTFVEWQLNGKTYDFNSAVTGNITLTAVWKAKNKYTVTFNSNGGSSVTSQTITEGAKATKPSNPTKSHYNFKEWQLNGKAYDFGSVVTGNITLTAVWEQKKFTVKKTLVDQYSPDVKLTVYEEGQLVSFSKITYNGNVVPTIVNASSISNIKSVKVTLTDGTIVDATVE